MELVCVLRPDTPAPGFRYVLDLEKGTVEGVKVLDSIATERNDYNRYKTGM